MQMLTEQMCVHLKYVWRSGIGVADEGNEEILLQGVGHVHLLDGQVLQELVVAHQRDRQLERQVVARL